jgi:TolB protein
MRAAAASVLIVAGVMTLLAVIPAGATAPGENGEITFRRFIGPGDGVSTIFTIRPDGTHERQVSRPPEDGFDEFPDYAADGSLIALARCGPPVCKVMVARPDGSGVREVSPRCKRPPVGDRIGPGCSENFYPALSPDGRRVAFTHQFGRITDEQIDYAGIYSARLSGGGLRRITLPQKRTAADNEAQWSPDGRKLVFVRRFLDGHNTNLRQALYTVNADGSGLRRVTAFSLNAGDGPDWSPDGSRILFRSPENDDFLHSQLYTIRPDGSGLKQVTHVPDGTTLYSASFSPDGKRITVAMQGVGGAADIYTMKTDGTGITPVTRTAERDSAPDWGGVR